MENDLFPQEVRAAYTQASAVSGVSLNSTLAPVALDTDTKISDDA